MKAGRLKEAVDVADDKTIRTLETASTYKIGNKTAVVNCVFKKENAPDINKILVKLMQSDIEKSR